MSSGIDCCQSCPTVQYVNVPGAPGEKGDTGEPGENGYITPGLVDPDGNVIGSEGQTYFNKTNQSFWIKQSGVDEYGWVCLIGAAACLLFVLFLSCFTASAAPILQTYYTTNTTPVVSLAITNASLVSQTNNSTWTSNYIASLVSTNVAISNQLSYVVVTNSAYRQGLIGQTNNHSYLSNLSATISLTNATVRASITNAAISAIAADVTKQPASANLTNWSARPQGLSCMIFAVDDLAITNQLWFTNGVLYATNRYSF